MSVLLLSEDDVRRLLTMDEALEAVEAGLKKLALDEAENVPRSRCRTDHAMLHVLPASAKGLGVLGYKAYVTGKKGTNFQVALFDGRTGVQLALMQADYLGQVRTGAASGVATRLLARPEAATVGLYGTGKQARTQLLAVCKARPIRRVQVYGRDADRRRRFAEEMSAACGTEVVPVDRPEAAAEKLDIIITATSSREPVLRGAWVAEGAHLNVVGSNFLGKAEIDVDTVRRAGLVVVDSKEQAKIESGDLLPAVEQGVLHWSNLIDLSQAIVGAARGRKDPREITIFKSHGIGIEDIAVAARVYSRAKEQGVGRTLDW
jgi:ornithine cyclodeaminase/alanine dehydrogenase-like protein (mu-crystallin family)